MKQQPTLLATLLLTALILTAPTIIDETTTDFQTGSHTNINTSNDQLTLTLNNGAYATSGTYNSAIYDLTSNPEGTISWDATNPPSTTLLVRTRSGQTPTYQPSNWSSWSDPYTSSTESELTSPTNRYWQYRLELGTTDTTNTPTIHRITLQYTETGPAIQEATNQPLTQESTGDYQFNTTITDTINLDTTQGRYRIGSDSWSSWQALTPTTTNNYYLLVNEPTTGWQARAGENLTVELQATNNQSNTTTQQFNKEILAINQPPTIDAVADQTATEGEELTVTLTASDPDGDNLTYTTTHGSITKITNTEADLTWTPTRTDLGLTNITVTVSDGEYEDSTWFLVNTTGVNHPPQLRAVANKTAYHGATINWTLTADDLNLNDNLTFTSTPALNWQEHNNTATTEYRASASFVALDNYRGETEFTFRVQDASGASDQTTATLTVNYCGDGICHENENATSCPQDCTQTTTQQYLAIEFENRICKNQTTTITVFNASDRHICFSEGRTTNGAAYCQPIGGVNVDLYEQQLGAQRTQLTTQTTNEQGEITFTPPRANRYRAIASEEGLRTAESTFTAGACLPTTDETGTVIERERPDITATPRPTTTPREERPDLTPQELNLVAIILFYILVPLLAASLIYLSTEYYQEYKDLDPRLLALRIRLVQLHQQHILPYWKPIKEALTPYTQPAWNWIKQHLLKPLNKRVIQPLKNRLRKQ